MIRHPPRSPLFPYTTLSRPRRAFLQGSGPPVFLLAFQVPLHRADAQRAPAPADRFNAFIAISEDNFVTAILAQTEGRQGSSTGMTQVIAAELGAAWSNIRYQFTTERRPEYINPLLYEGLILTAGASSITRFYGA